LKKLSKPSRVIKIIPSGRKSARCLKLETVIAKISGLTNAQSQEVLVIEAGQQKIKAVALNLEEDFVGALILGDGYLVKSGQTVKKNKTNPFYTGRRAIIGKSCRSVGKSFRRQEFYIQ